MKIDHRHLLVPLALVGLVAAFARSPEAVLAAPGRRHRDRRAARRRHGARCRDAGTVRMENDPRFNAGTGANIRLDGKSIQMDAAIMTGEGRFAAIGAIERVRNPIQVARAVMDSTPHLFLVGEGATRFAHRIGFPEEVPVCPESEARYRVHMKRQAEVFGRTDTTWFDWRRYWNFPLPTPPDVPEWGRRGDPVGTVARDASGRFAAAVEEAVAAFPPKFDVGLIAVDRRGWGVAANRRMAHGVAGAAVGGAR